MKITSDMFNASGLYDIFILSFFRLLILSERKDMHGKKLTPASVSLS